MNVDDERVLALGIQPDRLGEERFDLELVIVRDERERIDVAEGFAAQQGGVQIGGFVRIDVQLRRIGR